MRKPKPGKSLAEQRPELVEEWSKKNELTPWDVGIGSSYKALWLCEKHGEYISTCSHKTSGRGCPTCGKIKYCKKLSTPPTGQSLAEKLPDLADEWSYKNQLRPCDVYPSSHKKVWWVCKKHGEWLASCNSRSRGSRCYKCSKIKSAEKQSTPIPSQSLNFIHPDLSSEWSPNNSKSTLEVYPQSNKKYWWVCKEHGDFLMSCKNRVEGQGCPECSKIQRIKKLSTPSLEKSLAYLYPDLATEWSDKNALSPEEVYPQSNKKYWWVCEKGHEWFSYCYSRTGSNRTFCPTCATNKTSNIEQNLCNLLQGVNRYKISNWEVDIYFPDSQTVLEYDGSYFHSMENKLSIDTRKSLDLLSLGYKVIRIREISNRFQLQSLEITNPNYYEIFYENGYHKKYSSVPMEWLITAIEKNLLDNSE